MKRLLALSIVLGLALFSYASAADGYKERIGQWGLVKNNLILASKYPTPAEKIDHSLTDEIIAAVKSGNNEKVENLLKRHANHAAEDTFQKTLLEIAEKKHAEAVGKKRHAKKVEERKQLATKSSNRIKRPGPLW